MPKVMIVDDEPEIVELFDYFFRKHGFDVVKCFGGEDAVKVIDSDVFQGVDLVILDRRMPKIDGPAVLDYLRNKQKREQVAVIMLTGSYSGETDTPDVDELLTKPVNLQYILEKVNNLISRKITQKGKNSL